MSFLKPLTEPEIRNAFVNCTKGEAKRLHVPRDLAGHPWDDLDFLGWRDPRAPGRSYLVTELDGRPVGVQLRSSPRANTPERGRGPAIDLELCDLLGNDIRSPHRFKLNSRDDETPTGDAVPVFGKRSFAEPE